MSSDLLKEFGSPGKNPWHGVASQSPLNQSSALEDDFGDFETPVHDNVTQTRPTSSPSSNIVSHSVGSEYSGSRTFSLEQEYVQSSIDLSGDLFGTEVQHLPNREDDRGFPKHSVLFDADVEATRQKSEACRESVDESGPEALINIGLQHPTATNAINPKSPMRPMNNMNGSQVSQSPSLTKARHHSSKYDSKCGVVVARAGNMEQPTFDDELWVDFEDAEAANYGPPPSIAPSLHSVEAAKASNLGPPPSNIPPPSILLPVTATVLRSLTTNLKTISSHQPLDQPSILSHLRASLSTIRAAARILAGRRLRWKRDILLSQSMKIGPAHSGKAGGMKLAGVDKAESRREDQEAAETLQVWKQQAGPLRSMIATLNGQIKEFERFKIPEIAENMFIRQGKPSEGMVIAPKCCFLCGIKRNERVAKVDVDVEDSFGEWWAEHWGHVDCVTFWEEHKESLRQR